MKKSKKKITKKHIVAVIVTLVTVLTVATPAFASDTPGTVFRGWISNTYQWLYSDGIALFLILAAMCVLMIALTGVLSDRMSMQWKQRIWIVVGAFIVFLLLPFLYKYLTGQLTGYYKINIFGN